MAALSAKTDLDLTQIPALLTSLNLGSITSLAQADPIAGAYRRGAPKHYRLIIG